MTPLPRESIQCNGDEVIVDAARLAAWLNLPEASLREEMRAGNIRTLMENGEGEDRGRIRLTFRYKDRQFSIMREPDGQLHETAPPSPGPRPASPALIRVTQL